MDHSTITIMITDSSGNRRCIIVQRRTTLSQLLRDTIGGSHIIAGGDRYYGPENYNSTLEELNIASGADLEIVQPFKQPVL